MPQLKISTHRLSFVLKKKQPHSENEKMINWFSITSKADTLRLCRRDKDLQWVVAIFMSAAEKIVHKTLFTSDYTKKTALLQLGALADL